MTAAAVDEEGVGAGAADVAGAAVVPPAALEPPAAAVAAGTTVGFKLARAPEALSTAIAPV